MQAVSPLLFSACLVAAFACSRAQRRDRDSIDLTQDVTTDRKPQDKSFADFEKNWRRFISASPELAMPVVTLEKTPGGALWEPAVVSECVSSPGAGGLVPQVTLTWSGPPSGSAGAADPSRDVPALRFDLAVHHDGFGRNYYSSALASDRHERFELPSNSALIENPEAVLLTGPGLFPRLAGFEAQAVQDRDTGRRLERYTLTLQDLSAGLSYAIREDRRSDDEWTAGGSFVFLTPVCPR